MANHMITIVGTTDLLPSTSTANDVGPLVTAPNDKFVRALIRNTGQSDVFLGFTTAAVVGNPGAQAAYRLPAGQSDVFVLTPRQALYATSVGGGGRVSFAVSQALPIDMRVG
jgi:hypothetical protein